MAVLLILVLLCSVRLTNVTVKGNSRYTAQEAEDMVFPGFMDRNTVYCLITDKFRKHRELPFVQDYDIQITGPFSCDLVIYEKNVVGYVRFMSSCMYFDKDGVIVESSDQQLPGVPEVSGLQFGHIVLNQKLPVADDGLFNEIMNITQQLEYYGIACDRLQFDTDGNIGLILSGGAIDVELGNEKDIDPKLSVLNDMLPKLEGLSGTLDLSTYEEGGNGNRITTFRRRSGTAANGTGANEAGVNEAGINESETDGGKEEQAGESETAAGAETSAAE